VFFEKENRVVEGGGFSPTFLYFSFHREFGENPPPSATLDDIKCFSAFSSTFYCGVTWGIKLYMILELHTPSDTTHRTHNPLYSRVAPVYHIGYGRGVARSEIKG
jgi:hypothetical protein